MGRMWMINPKLLCNKHLVAEHAELHMIAGGIKKGYSISGRLTPQVQIEPLKMKKRHDELVKEMLRRGMDHNSPFTQPNLSKYGDEVKVHVNLEKNIEDLAKRCPKCRKRIKEYRKRRN